MATFAIVGAGMMGSALCPPLVDRDHEVRLVGTHLDRNIIEGLRSDGVHPKLRVPLDAAVRPFFSEELEEAITGVDVLVLGVNSQGFRWAVDQLRPRARPDVPIAMITKGLEHDGSALKVLPEVLQQQLPNVAPPVGITGPCIAGELARRAETCVVFSSRDVAVADRVAELMRTKYYHVRTSKDVAAHETCAALKNAYAMGIGFGAGLHERRGGEAGSVALHNYESAVFAQAVREMGQIVSLVGGDRDVVPGLSGVGDLDVTTNGGRTGRFGRWLGLGLGLDEAIEKMEGATLECLDVLDVLRASLPIYQGNGVLSADDLPLLRHLIAVALEGAAVDMPFDQFFR